MPKLNAGRQAQIVARTIKNMAIGKPITVSFEVTYNCNADCKHCDLGLYNKIDEPKLGPEVFAAHIARLRPAVAQISGGEPLIRRDIFDIIRAMREKDPVAVFVITTNVQILNEERYFKLREAGVDQFSWSFDYPDERHNEFRKLHKNFEHIRELAPKLAKHGNSDILLACVVQSDNFRDLPRIAEVAAEWGVGVNYSTYNCMRTGDESYLFKDKDKLDELRKVVDKLVRMQSEGYPIMTSEWTLREMIKFFESGKKENCRAGERFLIVNPWGKLTPCGMFRERYDSQEDLKRRFSAHNQCDKCFTAIRANSEKTAYRMMSDALRVVRLGK